MRNSHLKSKLPTAVLGAQHPKLFFFFLLSMILSRGFIEFFENAKISIFKIDDTSNEKRRGTKVRPKICLFSKMKKGKILIPARGGKIRFRERE